MAENLSALDLFDTELPTFISGLLSEAGLPPSRLVLEITESAIMKDTAYALKILRDLKRRGVVLAIDDFGTGYSPVEEAPPLPRCHLLETAASRPPLCYVERSRSR